MGNKNHNPSKAEIGFNDVSERGHQAISLSDIEKLAGITHHDPQKRLGALDVLRRVSGTPSAYTDGHAEVLERITKGSEISESDPRALQEAKSAAASLAQTASDIVALSELHSGLIREAGRDCEQTLALNRVVQRLAEDLALLARNVLLQFDEAAFLFRKLNGVSDLPAVSPLRLDRIRRLLRINGRDIAALSGPAGTPEYAAGFRALVRVLAELDGKFPEQVLRPRSLEWALERMTLASSGFGAWTAVTKSEEVCAAAVGAANVMWRLMPGSGLSEKACAQEAAVFVSAAGHAAALAAELADM